MPEALHRELIFLWYYFSIMISLIARFWVFGMILGSLISVFGKEKLHSLLTAMRNKNLGVMGIIPAALIGIASPLCMFGTIPISASLAEKGIKEDWLAAFMMSSVLLNPQLLFYSAALGNAALVIRFVSALLCGIAAGLLVRFFLKDRKLFNFARFTEAENRDTDPNPFLRFLKSLFRNLKATGPAFLIGICLATLFQRYIPADAVAAVFGRQRGFGLLMAASIGVPLHVCGGGAIPLLLAWMQYGMSLGAAAVFMITGPAMRITNLGAVKIVLGMKNFAAYIVFVFLFALFVGFLIDFVLW